MGADFPLYRNDEFRAMTKNQRSLDSADMMSSLMPSEKYSCCRVAHVDKGKHRNRSAIHRPGGFLVHADRYEPANRRTTLACSRLHIRNKPESLPGDGPDQILLLAAVSDCCSSRVDAARQRRLRNDAIAPN